MTISHADVAQLAEQLNRNQQVIGSIPTVGLKGRKLNVNHLCLRPLCALLVSYIVRDLYKVKGERNLRIIIIAVMYQIAVY